MSVEISEIGIRMVVGDSTTALASKPRDRPVGPHDGAPLTQVQIDALVQTCVQQVLNTLRMLEDR